MPSLLPLLLLLQAGTPPDSLPVIAPWKGFREAALSLTFDDNSSGQFAKALPLLDARGLRATFFVITDRMDADAWRRASDAAARGHEIGSHTCAHLVLPRETPSMQEKQLARSQQLIDSIIPFRRCVSFAYPYGAWDSVTLAAARRHYIAARVVTQPANPASPADPYRVDGRGPSPGMGPEILGEWLAETLAKKGWMVEVYHGVEDEGSEPVTVTWMLHHLDDIARSRDRLWTAPFGEVARYARERDAARLSRGTSDDSTLSYMLSDTLPDSLYGEPLTLRIALPKGWEDARLFQGGKPILSETRRDDGGGSVIFEATPDRGVVILRRRR